MDTVFMEEFLQWSKKNDVSHFVVSFTGTCDRGVYIEDITARLTNSDCIKIPEWIPGSQLFVLAKKRLGIDPSRIRYFFSDLANEKLPRKEIDSWVSIHYKNGWADYQFWGTMMFNVRCENAHHYWAIFSNGILEVPYDFNFKI
jgi:hypothetical protein